MNSPTVEQRSEWAVLADKLEEARPEDLMVSELGKAADAIKSLLAALDQAENAQRGGDGTPA